MREGAEEPDVEVVTIAFRGEWAVFCYTAVPRIRRPGEVLGDGAGYWPGHGCGGLDVMVDLGEAHAD